MFRFLSIIVLLAAFAVQTFSQVITMLDYYVNTTTYAKNCENKARPMLKCKGKCQMMKKLREEEKKDQQNPERKIENKSETLLSSKSFFPLPVFTCLFVKINFPSAPLFKEAGMPRSLLRPPIC